MNAKRGYIPDDDRNFSPEALQAMQAASQHINYLINEGYDLKTILMHAAGLKTPEAYDGKCLQAAGKEMAAFCNGMPGV